MSYFSSDFVLGILGGGQLGKMLLDITRRWDIKTAVLDSKDDAPSKFGTNHFFLGDLMDFDTVYSFGKQVSVLTIEIEHVNIQALEQLEKEGVAVFPQPKVLAEIQNKVRQKLFYVDHAIPTATFWRFAEKEEINSSLARKSFDFPFVWKSARLGYDGMGVKVVRNHSDLEKLADGECLIEEFVPFTHELSVIVARSREGKVQTYPVVEMEFHPEANQVEYVICPARITDEILEKAEQVARKTSEAFNHVGLLAVELFVTVAGEVLVNEVAPRPHNSGHYSIEGSYTSQFEQHLRCILGLPLGDTSSTFPAVMVNMVGEEGYKGEVHYENLEVIMQAKGVYPHIYGKKETRPFRKMGHVTVLGHTVAYARELAEYVKKTVRVISRK